MERFFKRPWIIAAVVAAITVFFAVQLTRIEIDNNNFRFVPKNNQERIISDGIDETFGDAVVVMVGLERKFGSIFDADFLNAVKEYGRRMEMIPLVDSVTSLMTTSYITGIGDSIVVEDIVPEGFSGTDEEIRELKTRLLSWDMFRGSIYSDDFTATQIVIALDTANDEAGSPEAMAALREIRTAAEDVFSGMAEIYISGVPVISASINEYILDDVFFLIPLVILVVVAILFFSFRSATGVFLPLLTVIVAVIWSVGAMPLFGIKVSMLAAMIPVILVAVGSAYGIHVITHYIEDRGISGEMTREEHRALVFRLLRKIGKPVFLAALTTVSGFISFCFTQVVPIREFGIFGSFGVVVAFGVSVTLIPALLLIRGPKPIGIRKRGKVPGVTRDVLAEGAGGGSGRASEKIADFFLSITARRGLVLFVLAAAILLSLVGVNRIIIENVTMEYFNKNSGIVRSDEFIRKYFGGSKIVNMVISSETPGRVLHPDVLGPLDDMAGYLKDRYPEVGTVTSIVDMVKRINQVFNVDEPPGGLRASVRAAPALPYSEEGFGFGFAEEPAEDFGFGFGFGFAEGPEEDFGFGFGEGSGVLEGGGFGDFREEGFSGGEPAEADGTVGLEELLARLDAAAGAGKGALIDPDDLLWELKRGINYQGASYFEVPRDPQKYNKADGDELQGLISNYLILLSSDIDAFADDPLEPKSIKMSVVMRTVGQHDTDVIVDAMKEYAGAFLPPDVAVTVGGFALVEASLNSLIVESQIISIIISLGMVFLILAISYRSVVAGLLGLLQLGLIIFFNFGVMGLAGIKLNIVAALVSSISVGIGIDYIIHFIDSCRRTYAASGGREGFIRDAFATSGKAILVNALSVGAGFGVLMLSSFVIIKEFGFLIMFSMITSSIISLTLLPVLIMWIKPKFIFVKEK